MEEYGKEMIRGAIHIEIILWFQLRNRRTKAYDLD